MSAISWLSTYLATLVAFLILDLGWLGYVGRGLYLRYMGDIMLEQPRWGAAVAFYLIYIAGLLWFAVRPTLTSGDPSLARAALMGAGFGFVTYATFDLTTLATIRGFHGTIAAIDMVWGTALGAGVASVAFLTATRWISV